MAITFSKRQCDDKLLLYITESCEVCHLDPSCITIMNKNNFPRPRYHYHSSLRQSENFRGTREESQFVESEKNLKFYRYSYSTLPTLKIRL
jgi:hypothetical protein